MPSGHEHEDGEAWNYAQGDATLLQGAEFTVYNRSGLTPTSTTRTAMGASRRQEEFRPGEAVMTIATAYNESLDA